MADDAACVVLRYWAFISYSHKDAAFGRWLHRRLENYALPRRLVGRATKQGKVPRQLVPIFRDREEFPAATDVSAEVRAALAQSRSLIVVCSPNAAASPWVSREVELFRTLHPDRPILAALHDGEPSQSFPDALLGIGPSGEKIEPLAADFRARHDGRQLGVLKLVAGIAGLGLDELAQRDAQRNRQRVIAVTVGSAIAVLIMSVLTAAAVLARREAENQRAKAEGLVEFMLTDLREKLKGVGRLDVMTAVNEQAFQYYAGQTLSSLPADSLERRARTLHAMGADDEDRGDYQGAVSKFVQAERTTAELLKDAPNNPERVFDHAQSVYWIGYAALQQKQIANARKQFLEYRNLATRMIALDPASRKYRQELDYAEGNLCTIALIGAGDRKEALQHCAADLAYWKSGMKSVGKNKRGVPAREDFENQLINAYANMSDALFINNNMNGARADRLAEEALLEKEMAEDPKNMDLKDTWVILQRTLAAIDRRDGDANSARRRLRNALIAATELLKYDPANKEWAKDKGNIERDLLRIQPH